MKESRTTNGWRWVLTTFCTLSVVAPAPALASILVQAAVIAPAQEESETETVKTEPKRSERRVDVRRLARPPVIFALGQHARQQAPACGLNVDLRAELQTRCLSLRC